MTETTKFKSDLEVVASIAYSFSFHAQQSDADWWRLKRSAAAGGGYSAVLVDRCYAQARTILGVLSRREDWAARVRVWHHIVFGERAVDHGAKVYSMRLLEEALELAQAENVSVADATAIVAQVYAKPPGDPAKELGGVTITLAGYASQAGASLSEAFEREFARIQDPGLIERIRYRNLHGDKLGMRKTPPAN